LPCKKCAEFLAAIKARNPNLVIKVSSAEEMVYDMTGKGVLLRGDVEFTLAADDAAVSALEIRKQHLTTRVSNGSKNVEVARSLKMLSLADPMHRLPIPTPVNPGPVPSHLSGLSDDIRQAWTDARDQVSQAKDLTEADPVKHLEYMAELGKAFPTAETLKVSQLFEDYFWPSLTYVLLCRRRSKAWPTW
jgi:hypothetical protein